MRTYTADEVDEMIARALAREREQHKPKEPVGRTDQQIVDQTEELAVWLLSWAFNRQPETPTPMRKSRHPMAERCWAAACHIQEMLTATDPENSVGELDDEPGEYTSSQPSKQWVGLEPQDFAGVIKGDAFEAGAYWANNILRGKNNG